MFIMFLLSGNDIISLESRPLIFMYSYTRTRSIQEHFVKYKVKRKYPKETSTVDKVGCEKLLSEEILFRVELIASSFFI